MTLTLSLSLNCSLTAPGQHKTIMLPLAWLTLPIEKWQRALTAAGIIGRSLAWALL